MDIIRKSGRAEWLMLEWLIVQIAVLRVSGLAPNPTENSKKKQKICDGFAFPSPSQELT